MNDVAFDWSPLGEAFWWEAQKTTGASSLQTKFACCRHRGMTASGSARISGYQGDAVTIRQAGHRAAKSTAVLELLALAAAEAGGGNDGVVGTEEAKRILSRLARGSDPTVRIRALESLAKFEGQGPSYNKDDHLIDYRLARSFLQLKNGASSFMLYYNGSRGSIGHPANFPLLHDVAYFAAREPFGSAIWDRLCRDLSETMRECLRERLSDPGCQLEWRKAVWGEIYKEPPGGIDGAIDPREVKDTPFYVRTNVSH